MKKALTILFFLFVSITIAGQEKIYKEYSYTELFKMIEEEQDSVFKLSNALIKYNPKTDQRFRSKGNPNQKKDTAYVHRNDIVVNKHIELSNVQFSLDLNNSSNYFEGVLMDIHFTKSVHLENVKSLSIEYCRFEDLFRYSLSNCDLNIPQKFGNYIYLQYSNFKNVQFFSNCQESSNTVSTWLLGNSFTPTKKKGSFFLNARSNSNFVFEENVIANSDIIYLTISDIKGIMSLRDNVFESDFIHISKTNLDGKLRWTNNRFSSPVFLELDPFSSGDEIDWNQFNKKYVAYNSFMGFTLRSLNRYPVQLKTETRNKLVKQYIDSVRVYDDNAFTDEISLKSHFYSHFRSRYNTQIANKVYIDLKDFETKRLEIEYNKNSGFRPYFKWKVNQFLKVFSDYGTEPSKAIVGSMYVILLFAFIYLLFPNSWDSHGKNRIMNRYRFFTKYMNKESGIHEVYLEDAQTELIEYEDFKNYMVSNSKNMPTFFTATALPLYKWAISGTKFSASVLKRVDIMKGAWSELPQQKRIWKSILLIGAFTIAICYDVLIKMLNALMLSINTFTTLGFGEIPIKGLPRYLAIIQGFIGWFMLTIFSVSLISQLLN
ncbi:potassium channel family protein [Flavobacteriaceae bacterium S0862]|nr:potassium channel family protein [Flavobacteriaceae bacterium S0862]